MTFFVIVHLTFTFSFKCSMGMIHCIDYGIVIKSVSICKQKMSHTKSQSILCRKRISMLAGLKVSSLISKCVLYRQEHNEKWDRAHSVDEKSEVICLFIMLSSRVMDMKMPKMAYFLYIFQKTSYSFGKTFKCSW